MKVNEKALLDSGFTPADIRKVKTNVQNFGGTLDEVIQDLARRFIAAKWITIVALVVLFFTSVFASRDNSLSLAFSLVVGLPFIWYLTPARLAFKAWRYKRYVSRIKSGQ